jgi:hypothetical protein
MAAKDRECDFQDIYLGVWPAREEKYLYELATEYHERTEAYDRTVCTGGFRNGRILPATGHETMLINRNALAIRQELEERAKNHGMNRQQVKEAIHRYDR